MTEVVDAPPIGRAARGRAWVREHALELVLAVVAVVPFVVAVVRAVAHGYIPVGDDALIALRVRDVFTVHQPLLGTGSSASITLGVDVNHPGPAMFDLLAPFARVLGTGTGIAVGVTLGNILCLLGAAVMAHRIAGRRAFVLVLLLGTALAWSMGSEYLFDVWQPNQLVFPFLLVLVLGWAVAAGRVWALPWACGVGSVIVQTHVSYVYLVPVVIATGLVLAAVADRSRVRALLAPLGTGLGVTLIVWAQPLHQAWFGPGPSNLARLVDAARGSHGHIVPIGGPEAVRLAAAVIAMPPWILRPSYATKLLDGPLPSSGVGLALLSSLVVLLVLAAVTARGSARRPERSAAVLAAVALVTAVVALARQPVSGYVFPAAHQMRWLWPVAAFVAVALLLRVTTSERAARGVAIAGAVLIPVLAVLNLPTYIEPRLDAGAEAARPAVRAMRADIGRLRGRGTLLYDSSTEVFGQPYGAALLQAMGEDGIPFVVRDRFLRLQVGPRRIDRGCRSACDVREAVFVLTGGDAWTVPAGSERVILVRGITTSEADRLERLERTLTAAGARIATTGSVTRVPSDLRRDAAAYEALRGRRDLGSVAVFVRPLP